MRAILTGRVIAESDDVIEVSGYAYFPREAVTDTHLEKAPKGDLTATANRVGFWQDVEIG